MTKKPNTIVLTGGGSGGHITPLLALARELKKKDPKCLIVYIGLKEEKVEGLQSHYQAFDRVYAVPAGKFRRYHGESFLAHLVDFKTLFLNIRDFFRVIRGIFASRKILKEVQPDVVFSKGGFVAVPVGLAAHRLGINIVTHDSDTVPGLANRIIGRWARVHATGMPPEFYSYPPESIYYSGIPVSDVFRPVTSGSQNFFKQELGLPSSAQVLLVTGGGLGSKNLNDLTLASAKALLAKFSELHIVHLCGTDHEEQVRITYETMFGPAYNSRVTVVGFSDQFHVLSGAADLVVTRAGATTIADLAMQGKAAVIVPSPFLAGGHQLKNAELLEKNKAAVILPDDVKPEDFTRCIESLLSDPAKAKAFADQLAKLARPDAAKALAELLLEHPTSAGESAQ